MKGKDKGEKWNPPLWIQFFTKKKSFSNWVHLEREPLDSFSVKVHSLESVNCFSSIT